MRKKLSALTALVLTLPLWTFAQENSPYSRYGLGDLTPGKSMISRGMGGITAALKDDQAVNFNNPASYSNLILTTFDIGVDLNSRAFKDVNAAQKYTSNNLYVSYLQIGIPLISRFSKKGLAKDQSWGMNIGLQPMTRVSYKIESSTRIIDSINYLNEGTGGSYFAFIGTGYRIKNFSVGANLGYMFGTKDINNRKIFINDSVIYAKSNVQNRAVFGNLYYNLGVQYSILLKKGKDKQNSQYLRLGAYGALKQKINVKTDSVYETFGYDALGGTFKQDSIYENRNIKGTIDYPANFGFGFMYEKENEFAFGVDFSVSQWSQYRFTSKADYVTNGWMVNAGGQLFIRNKKVTAGEKAPKIVRAGLYYGQDIMNVTGKMPVWGISIGGGIPVYRSRFSTQYTTINPLFEFGGRGKNSNSIKENFFRIGIGLSLSDFWFRKYKYQ